MAGRTTRRVPTELKAIQDERLTCRHIKALMQLQQVTDENQELKSKVQTLEKEISSCHELHKIARDSEKTLKKLDEDWRATMEKNLSQLNASHKKKLMDLLAAGEKARQSEEKNKSELQMRIEQLETETEELKKAEAQQNSNQEIIKELEAKLDEAMSKVENSEMLIKKLTHELKENKSREDINASERKANKTVIDDLKRKLENLSLKLSVEMESKKKLIEQSDLCKELEKQRCLIESFEEEKKAYESNIEELRLELDDYGKRMRDLERENMMILLERDALQQSSTDLKNEVDYLKGRGPVQKSSSNDFEEYIKLKREYISLKEENMKLKSASSKSEIKTLKCERPKSKLTGTKSISASRKF